jgi:tetratricopeptide (TPR) repeat protein
LCEELRIQAYCGRGDVNNLIGNYQEAKNDFGLLLSLNLKPQTKISALLGLSEVNESMGNFDKAISYTDQAGRLAEKNRLAMERIKAFISKSMLLYRKGEYSASEKLSKRCLALLNGIGELNRAEAVQRSMGKILNNIGNVYYDSKQFRKAIDVYKKALIIEQRMNNPKGLGTLYNNIGIVSRKLNRPKEAIRYYEKAATYFERIGDRFGEMTILANLAISYSDLKEVNYEKVFELFGKALLFAENIGNETLIIWFLNNIAAIYVEQYRFKEAMLTFKKALRKAEKKNDRTMIAMIYGNIANTHVFKGELSDALDNYHKCARIRRVIFGEQAIAYTTFKIAEIEYEQGKMRSLLSHFNQLKKLVEKFKLIDEKGYLLTVQGNILTSRKEYKKATSYYRKALKIFINANQDERSALCLCKIASNMLAEDKPNIPLLRKTLSDAKRYAAKSGKEEPPFHVCRAHLDFSLYQRNIAVAKKHLAELKSLVEVPSLSRFYPHYLMREAKLALLQGKPAGKQLNAARKKARVMDLKPLLEEIKLIRDTSQF